MKYMGKMYWLQSNTVFRSTVKIKYRFAKWKKHECYSSGGGTVTQVLYLEYLEFTYVFPLHGTLYCQSMTFPRETLYFLRHHLY